MRKKRNVKNNRNQSLQRIASKALYASVVLTEIEQTGPLKNGFMKGKKVAAGSGFYVAPDLIVTNIHCVVGTTWVFPEPISLPNPSPIEGVVAYDDQMDLVILRLADEGIPLSLADSDAAKVGERVYAIRCTGGGIEERGARGAVTEGTVHSVRQSDAHLCLRTILSHGNSGGPVINKTGEVIGVAVAGGSSLDSAGGINKNDFAYAIPSNVVKHLLATAEAEEPFDAWREKPRIHAYAEASHAYLKQRNGQFKAAIKHYTAALELNPDLVSLYHNRGALRNATGQHKAAIADWDAALERNPDLVEVYFNRGGAKTAMGDFEGAIADCTTALQLQPDTMPAYYNRAQARMELNQYVEGIEDYDKVLQFPLSKEEAYGAYYNRALAKYLLGLDKTAEGEAAAAIPLYRSAIRDYTEAIKVAATPALISRNYNNRGYAKYLIAKYEAAKGNIGKAQSLYEAARVDSEAAIKEDRKNAYAYCTRAVAKAAFEEYAAAIDDFTQAIKLKSDFAHAYYQRGLSKQQLGQQKQAESDFRKAKQLDPDVETQA